jgi:hypothetical protein
VERGHPDRDEDVGQLDAELGDVAGWRLGRKSRRVLVVHAGEVRRVGQENADLDDVFERCPRRAQDGLAVEQRLACLLLNRRARSWAHAIPHRCR